MNTQALLTDLTPEREEMVSGGFLFAAATLAWALPTLFAAGGVVLAGWAVWGRPRRR